ncbi:hypothetical protein AGMMS49944_02140 [Spirochaetia bacterium]|nr:hypothetical protein AGMMS49944_02140 [Spirochaetia bacterium]
MKRKRGFAGKSFISCVLLVLLALGMVGTLTSCVDLMYAFTDAKIQREEQQRQQSIEKRKREDEYQRRREEAERQDREYRQDN